MRRDQKAIEKHIKHTVVFNKLADWLDRRRALSASIQEEGTLDRFLNYSEQEKIATLIEFYAIDMNDYDPDESSAYSCFDAFLQREFKDGARYLNGENPRKAIMCADSTVSIYENVPSTTQVEINGIKFCVATLVKDVAVGRAFDNRTIACFRLGPQHCHHFFSPVSGQIKEFETLPAVPVRGRGNDTTIMSREYVIINSPEFGQVLFVAIGTDSDNAQYVSFVYLRCLLTFPRIFCQFENSGVTVATGDELGHFRYDELYIAVAFQKDRLELDPYLQKCTKMRPFLYVQAGMILGFAAQPTPRQPEASQSCHSALDSTAESSEAVGQSADASEDKKSHADVVTEDLHPVDLHSAAQEGTRTSEDLPEQTNEDE